MFFSKKINPFRFIYKDPMVNLQIVGMKLIDYHPHINVEFVKGYFGDNQVTIKITADGHTIDAKFFFYVDYKPY